MRRFLLCAAAVALASCGSTSTSSSTGNSSLDDSAVPAEIAALPQLPTVALCGDSAPTGFAHCHSRAVADSAGNVQATQVPNGVTPSDLRAAYQLPAQGGNGTLVAIVDANDDPNAEADLAVYRARFGLPPCTSANGCFQKVNQLGAAGPYPTPDTGWSGEISLDLDMVSAVCPDCRILLVEANSPNMDDLGQAVNEAVTLGAKAVSNSYGGPEDSTVPVADELYFHHPGVTITVSAGDTGTGPEYPATSKYVTAVGGTVLAKSTTNPRGWVESAWGEGKWTRFLGGTGSGCSAFIAKPSWQTDTGCANRVEADVSADASPVSGPAVYDTYGSEGVGWMVVGGTSAASPIVAGIYALTGLAGNDASLSYAHPQAFNDVTSGSNGSCSGYVCNAAAGYDGPTGNGTPNGAALLTLAGAAGSDGGTALASTVTFQVDNATTVAGQNVYLVGDAAQLGAWDPTKAVALSPVSYPSWSANVSLPQGDVVSFKFIKIDSAGNVTWEGGSNRQLTVPAAASGFYGGSWQ